MKTDLLNQQKRILNNSLLNSHVVKDYTLIVIGSFLQALSYVLFLAPYKIIPGGVYGISIVIHYLTDGDRKSVV